MEEYLGDGDRFLAVRAERREDRRNRIVEIEEAVGGELHRGEAHRRLDRGVGVEPSIVTGFAIRLGVDDVAFETDCELKARQTTLVDFAPSTPDQVVETRRNDCGGQAHGSGTVVVLDEAPPFPTTGTSAFADRCQAAPFQTPTP